MQTLYSIDSMNKEMSRSEAVKILDTNLRHSTELFTYLVAFLTEVALYADKDANQKSQKHLPSEKDLNVSRKIAGNELVLELLQNENFIKSVKDSKTVYLVDEEIVRRCYLALIATPEYQEYIKNPVRDRRSDKKILELIFNTLMLPDEHFISDLEEKFLHWQDDADMMIVLLTNALQKPATLNFTDIIGKEKRDFSTSLLETTMEKKEVCKDLIKPKLKNWDAERIAALDMILMEMGVCEFLYFETIPPKVTINEYIDLAKEYSTEHSGHFINGILDSIHKDLVAQNKIHKKNFKNSIL